MHSKASGDYVDNNGATRMASGASNKSTGGTQVRVLSYNFNILPWGCSGFQKERITAFLSEVDKYDVLVLQEVYAASVLPYFVQRYVCFQKYLVDELRALGFHYYVISKQPSYPTLLRHSVLSDNGLVIASRFPIGQRGSYTFRNHEHVGRSVRRGCLFAEVKVPSAEEGESIIFFNVHLREKEDQNAISEHVKEMRRFIASVIGRLCANPDNVSKMPFVVAGDFNINGINLHSVGQPTKMYCDLVQELQTIGGGLREVIFDTCHNHPPTRPTKLFFPTLSKFNRNSLVAQRQDYFFVTPTVVVNEAQIRKFVANSREPYVYLSDHFGVAATLSAADTGAKARHKYTSLSIEGTSVAEEAINEHSNPIAGTKMELVVLLLMLLTANSLSWSTLLASGVLWFVVWWLFSSRIHGHNNDKQYARLQSAANGQKKWNKSKKWKAYRTLKGVVSLAEVWQRAMSFHASRLCLGRNNEANVPDWLSYNDVGARVQELASGLFALGITQGDIIGVDCDSCVGATILELTCVAYGFATLSLVGTCSTIRKLLDDYNVKVVFANRNAVASLLTCRSRVLETVVCLHPFSDAVDGIAARDVGITLLSYDEVFCKGRLRDAPLPPKLDGDALYSLVADPSTSSDSINVVRVTHSDALSVIHTLVNTAVLPNSRHGHLMVHYTPFSVLFNRIFVLGLFAHGSSVAVVAAASSQGAFEKFRPTILLAHPSLFYPSAAQLKRRNERSGMLRSWIFEKVYRLRSALINEYRRDSSFLRFCFFHSTQRMLGGNVEKIVLVSSEESISDDLEEHISVCYAPCLREVFFLPSEGVFCVDGVPVPDTRVELEPFDNAANEAKIGRVILIRDDISERRSLSIAGSWDDTGTLRFLGPLSGLLLPLKCDYVVAASLERVFAHSRYVNDIFLHADPSKPIVAIVSPNRDTVEFEWQQRQLRGDCPAGNTSCGSIKQNWMKFSQFSVGLILADFRDIAKGHGLNESTVPSFVHLHPHPFKDHDNFLTPYAGIRRNSMTHYFRSVIDNFYADRETPVCHTICPSPSSVEESEGREVFHDCLFLRVPVAIDIGGTFAKVVYVQPPTSFEVPDYVMHEASSLSEALSCPAFHLLDNSTNIKRSHNKCNNPMVGTVRFAKMPSKCIPDFMLYMNNAGMLRYYAKEHQKSVRVTGGGAFKYAALASKNLGAEFSVMREMEAVVQGLGLLIRIAPSSIFTVDPQTGEQLPHRLKCPHEETLKPYPCLLVNMGSGISIIKCLGPDGSHVRIGGSPIGGATFWGLVRRMTKLTSWEEVAEIMRVDGPGDNKNVDLLVGDIYGYNATDLPAMLSVDTVASCFGKYGTERFYEVKGDMLRRNLSSTDNLEGMFSSISTDNVLPATNGPSSPKSREPVLDIDIVRSLLNMISSNITQLAYLHSRIQNVPNIFFTGGFLRNNRFVHKHISFALQYWSRESVRRIS
ncbi:putative Endonuclease Exonuclease phosphatase family AMP binding enzyme Fumble [Trypanosoma vivax]|nr:putative Endonuclease Exonuclease phosphatase family AMP binding enzyme Fumble [Trypanosoma vivax]